MNSAAVIAGAATVVVAVILTTTLISRWSLFYRRELASDVGRRELPLDGLRGFAALMVVVHHAAMYRNWLRSGDWGDAGSPVLQAFGPGGVHLFFMLTGYLFWSKARAGGGKLRMASLWRGRLYRIAPLYLFSVMLILVTALAIKGSHLFDAGSLNPFCRLLTLGFLPWRPFGNFDVGNINAGVVWTLWYEWRFYLILPFIAWFACGRRVFLLAAASFAAVFAGLFFFGLNMQPGLVFTLGMLCPMLLDNEKLRAQLQTPAAAVLALAAAVVFGALNQAPLLSFPFAATLFPVFLTAAAGNTFFGVLVRPAIRCLGAISYSLYLLHGIVFYIVLNILRSKGLSALPGAYYWGISAITAVAITLLCAATYRWIEFPFLSRSHRKTVPKAREQGAVSVPESVH
jgi:peptidoglycan/LPS O-acetylase OafA/YrhL